MQLQWYLVAVGLSVAAHQVTASATANEFVRCNQLAAASVQQCQQVQQGQKVQPTGCDEVAERQRQQCQADVKQSHNPNDPERKARRAAQIKLQQQRQLESPTTPLPPEKTNGIESGH